ncbi:hypothetical protein BJ878DRAFT_150519 [Calycina marina]|uniref:SET domain-containing protein n=1 Tax=Calycina marina TaxID=1763456 RepID=A0A9P7ZC55_9HELO|nr:hypothetical protein BJ878DRAFT_150519 [Calycina marina]
MPRGTAADPFRLTPSPPPARSVQQVIEIFDSDEEESSSSLPKAKPAPASAPKSRLVSWGSPQYWNGGYRKEASPGSSPQGREPDSLSSPTPAATKKSPVSTPRAATSTLKATSSLQRSEGSSHHHVVKVSDLASRKPSPIPRFVPDVRNFNGQFSPSSGLKTDFKDKPARTSTPSSLVLDFEVQEDVSLQIARKPSLPPLYIPAVALHEDLPPRESSVPPLFVPHAGSTDEDVVMQDGDVFDMDQATEQDTALQQGLVAQPDEAMEVLQDSVLQYIVQHDDTVQEMDVDDQKEKPHHSSIDTESPLAQRLKQTRVSKVDGEEQTVDTNSLVYRLCKLVEDFEYDHSTTIQWLLHDARRSVSETSIFMDDGSPFASLKSITLTPGMPVPAGNRKLTLESRLNHGKKRLHLNSKTLESDVSRVPRYHAHTLVKRNLLTADDETLRYQPYLGDTYTWQGKQLHNRTQEELEIAYARKEPKSHFDIERQQNICRYLPYWLEALNIGITVKNLEQYVLSQDNWDVKMKAKDVAAMKAWDSIHIPASFKTCLQFDKALIEVFGWRVKTIILNEARQKELSHLAKMKRQEIKKRQTMASGSTKEAIAERLSTFTEWTCLICGVIYCQTHGDYREESVEDSESDIDQPQRPKFQYVHRQLVMDYTDMLRTHNLRHEGSTQEDDNEISAPACSDQCYQAIDLAMQDKYELASESRVGIESMLTTLTSPVKRTCTIAFALGVPCWQVHHYILNLERREVPLAIPLKDLAKSKRLDWYDNKKKTLKDHWQEYTEAHLHEKRVQTHACAHEGPCDADCHCFDMDILCEQFCGCSDDCPRKWTGCACSLGKRGLTCHTDTCICIQMNRECGPQCGSCGAISRILPQNKHNDELFTTGCQNVHLQRGVSKALLVGESRLKGFGLYMAEPARKGAYLSEYTGEVISANESERRGVIYDRKYLSFLFDLNRDWVIDAARFGNKTRFINHAESEKYGLNCGARILLVNGEHRIKFVALCDIAAGEELLFDYGRKFAEKQGLSAKIPKPNSGQKGLVVGEEEIDALDGLGRGKTPAIRGKRGGARPGAGRKPGKSTKPASKAARKPKPKPTIHPDDEMDIDAEEDDEESLVDCMEDSRDSDDVFKDASDSGSTGDDDENEDEDDGDVNIVVGREKRKSRPPARYAR